MRKGLADFGASRIFLMCCWVDRLRMSAVGYSARFHVLLSRKQWLMTRVQWWYIGLRLEEASARLEIKLCQAALVLSPIRYRFSLLGLLNFYAFAFLQSIHFYLYV